LLKYRSYVTPSKKVLYGPAEGTRLQLERP
jgi:hypothetical protein